MARRHHSTGPKSELAGRKAYARIRRPRPSTAANSQRVLAAPDNAQTASEGTKKIGHSSQEIHDAVVDLAGRRQVDDHVHAVRERLIALALQRRCKRRIEPADGSDDGPFPDPT